MVAGSWDVAQEPDLAEELARPFLAKHLPVTGVDLHPARVNDIEAVALLALPEDHSASGDLDADQGACQRVEVRTRRIDAPAGALT
jgi:hypothetical protein